MRLPPEFPEDDENADDEAMCRLVGSLIITGGFFLLIFILIFALTGCGSTFYGRDGQPVAYIAGDYTYQRTAAGAVAITLNHSKVITATGTAATKAITATGTAAILAAP